MQHVNLKILLIDDDPIYLLVAKKIIESAGFVGRLTVCADGQEAMYYLTGTEQNGDILPDIIFLDLDMPVMDGWSFLEEFEKFNNSLTKNIILYIVTSSPDAFEISKSRQYGSVKGYLIKPVLKAKFHQILTGLST